MATDERLKLRVDVVDNTTGPLRKISREVQNLASQRVDNLGRQFDNVRAKLAPLEGGISGVGMSLLRLAGPIGAVATVMGGAFLLAGKRVNEFARQTRSLSEMSRLTGFSTKTIEGFSQALENLDVSRQDAQNGLGQFAGALFKLRTHTGGDLVQLFGQRGGKEGKELTDRLTALAKAGKNDEALKVASDYIEKLEKIDPAKAAIVANALFGDANLAKVAHLREELAKIGEVHVGNAEAAQKYIDKVNKLNALQHRLTTDLGNKGLSGGNSIIEFLSPEQKAEASGKLGTDEDKLARINRRLGSMDPNSARFKDLSLEREDLVKEIEKLKKSLKDLNEATEPLAKKMSFMGPGGGSGSLLMNASYGGGGGYQSYWGEGGKAALAASAGMGRAGSPSGSGGGIGGAGSAGGNTASAMSAAMDQLRKEGVPEANLKHAAAALVGQATAESNLNPNTVHDGGTGYGVYGARLGRRSKMLSWLEKNGFAKDSLEGQMKYMAHEAMTDYPQSRSALMEANADNIGGVNRTLTRDFEAPAVKNYGDRLNATMGALSSLDTAGIDPHHMDPMAPAGSGLSRSPMTTVKSPSGRSFRVLSEFAPNFQRFVNRYEESGGLIGPQSGGLSGRPGNASYHPLGRAIDVNQIGRGIRGGGRPLPRDVEDRLAEESGLWPGSRFGDAGHFEVRNRELAIAKQRQWEQERRAQMDKAQGSEMSAKVEGTGKLTVDVNGPKGTKVGAEGGGLFKDVQINRSTQMQRAPSGPIDDIAEKRI